MTRACFDVFKEIGKPLVPMTGEANNGFLRAWKAAGADSVGPIFTPGLGPAMVRAAVALLEGQAAVQGLLLRSEADHQRELRSSTIVPTSTTPSGFPRRFPKTSSKRRSRS